MAGIEAVKHVFNVNIQQDFRLPKKTEQQEICTAWNDFPPVISNGKLGDLKNEPEYAAAKAGDVVQSALLVDKLLKDDTVQEIKKLIGDNQPILVSIQSEEASGKNRIPQATAFALAAKLGLQVDENIYQINTAKRTDSGIYHRYVSPPEFKGKVQADQSYWIVDDTLSVGGTIAALKGYIENNGGKVIGSTVMTAHELKVSIAITLNMLESLQQKQGLDQYWKQEFGYGVNKLTQQEAGHLRKPTLEQIQKWIDQAKLDQQNRNLSGNKALNHEQTTQTQPNKTQMSGISNLSDGAGSQGAETISSRSEQVFQSIFRQPQPSRTEEISPLTLTATSPKDVADLHSDTGKNIMENQRQHEFHPNSNPQEVTHTPMQDLSFKEPAITNEPPQKPTSPPAPEPTAISEKDVAVSSTAQPEKQTEMVNTIEYDGMTRDFRQPEVSSTPTPPESNTEPSAPHQSNPPTAITDLTYDVPEHLQERMSVVDTQRFRVKSYEMGDHVLRYVANQNTKTILFEDRGTHLHTARSDAKTIDDMLAVAKAKHWDSIKISGSPEFKQQMWLAAESQGIATKGYKPSPEDLVLLEHRRQNAATNSIAKAEQYKQQATVPSHQGDTSKAIHAADTVKAHATQAQQSPTQMAQQQYEHRLADLPPDQQSKARLYENLALSTLKLIPDEWREQTRQAIYENQMDLIHDGAYHAPDPLKSVERLPEPEKNQHASSGRDDWEMER